MRLDRILQILLPHDVHFYDMFEESAKNILKGSELLLQIPSAPRDDWAAIVEQIRDREHEGDDITHRIFAELSSTFVTPFDPEDIHLLASALDDILDNIDGSARRLLLYKIGECPAEMRKLIRSLNGSVTELERGVRLLRRLHRAHEMRDVIKRVNEYEDEADTIFARAVAELFETYSNPVEIIKIKEIYVALETATDKCEDAVDVLETLLIKHA